MCSIHIRHRSSAGRSDLRLVFANTVNLKEILAEWSTMLLPCGLAGNVVLSSWVHWVIGRYAGEQPEGITQLHQILQSPNKAAEVLSHSHLVQKRLSLEWSYIFSTSSSTPFAPPAPDNNSFRTRCKPAPSQAPERPLTPKPKQILSKKTSLQSSTTPHDHHHQPQPPCPPPPPSPAPSPPPPPPPIDT